MATISVREACFAAIAARLAARLTDVTVERNRDAPVDPAAEGAVVVVNDSDHEVIEGDGFGFTAYRFNVAVAGWVPEPTYPDTAADAASDLHVNVVSALLTNEAGALAPIAVQDDEIWLQETGTRFDRASVMESDQQLAAFVAEFSFIIRRPEGAPFFTI